MSRRLLYIVIMSKKVYIYCKILGIVLGLFLAPVCQAQMQPITISQIDSCMAQEAKPILMLLSTDWCKYCQMQKNQLRKNKDFQKKADLFYYVEFDAESKNSVRFNGQDYLFKATGISTGIHELAVALNGGGHPGFPTWILLDGNYQVLFRYKGVLLPQQIQTLLESIEALDFHEELVSLFERKGGELHKY